MIPNTHQNKFWMGQSRLTLNIWNELPKNSDLSPIENLWFTLLHKSLAF